jgi:DNA-binding response OmpR family regulator
MLSARANRAVEESGGLGEAGSRHTCIVAMEAPVKTILVVDDEQELGALAAHVLSQAGYEVHQVHDSYSALQILARDPVDLVIAVVRAPSLFGLELAEVIRRFNRLAETPLLGISAVPWTRLDPRTEVFDAFLGNPFSILDLLEQVSELLALTRLPRHPHLLPARFDA